MKKLFVLFFVVTGFNGCKNKESKAVDQPVLQPVDAVSKNSLAFNESFKKILDSYYALKDALVEADTSTANAASLRLAAYSNSLDVNEMTSDSTGAVKETAKNFSASVNSSALRFASETELVKKKKSFKTISDAMYDLVRAVRYDRETIYHQHCPMAINDTEEAYWLSNNGAVVNPYMGKKHPKYQDAMLACGDVTDSLDFTK